ncbi:hypothetical protein LMG26686_01096 [Achromobacter mucicolens]|nr:hypothetical protein LMG26686_01096 [Achromobacter mucicolens]
MRPKSGNPCQSGVARIRAPPVRCDAPWGEALRASGGRHLATGIVNSAPLAMLSGQRCITLL